MHAGSRTDSIYPQMPNVVQNLRRKPFSHHSLLSLLPSSYMIKKRPPYRVTYRNPEESHISFSSPSNSTSIQPHSKIVLPSKS